MNILHLSTSDSGGAGIAAVRLHKGLLEAGIESKILTLHKSNDQIPEHYQFINSDTLKANVFSRLINKIRFKARQYGFTKHPYFSRVEKYLKNQPAGHEMFSFPFSDFDLTEHPLVKQSDIINIHWVSGGFLDYKSFFKKNKKKVVWTLHDMNPFTGGCHYSEGYPGYITNCSHCPQLKNTIDEEYAFQMLALKKKIFDEVETENLTIVTPSNWLKECANQSSLFNRFNVHVIPNGFNEKVFFPTKKDLCRKTLGISPDQSVILFAAQSLTNERKGMKYLLQAAERMKDYDNLLLCSMGGKEGIDLANSRMLNFGYIQDETTAAILYNAADVFVSPSLHDNFPNTICESLLCGTPVAAFDVGGVSEQITTDTGVLVPIKDAEGLQKGITFILENPEIFNKENVSRVATEK